MNLSSVISKMKSPKTRRGKWLRWAAVVLLVYTITGFFILPAIIKSRLISKLPDLTHRRAVVQSVRMNPYALSLTVRGLSLTETNGESFAGFDEFYGRFSLFSVFRWAWSFSEVRLTHPTANILRGKDGEFNFANLFASKPAAQAQPQKPSTRLPIVLISQIVVTNGNLAFSDLTRSAPLQIVYSPINLALSDLTTKRNKNGLYSLAVSTQKGGDFTWQGTIMANPPRSAGTFTLRGMVLKTYSPYLGDFAKADITSGLLDIATDYQLQAGEGPLQFETTNTAVKLTNFKIAANDTGEILLALNDVEVSAASASLEERRARVPLITVRGGSFLARREKDGLLNWLKLLVPQTNAPASNNPGLAWNAALDELNLESFAVTADDLVPPSPAHLGLDDLHINVTGVSNQTNRPVTATISFNWGDGGKAKVVAQGTLLPPAGEAKIELEGLALPPIQPYVEQQARAVLNSGKLNVAGTARYGTPNSDSARTASPLIEFNGDISIDNFATIDSVSYQNLAKWDALALRGIHATLQTNALSVDEVKFTGLQSCLIVASNGQFAVQSLLRQPAIAWDDVRSPAYPAQSQKGLLTSSPTGDSSASSPAQSALPIKISALTFEKCSFRAADQSLTPHFDTSIEDFNGTIRDITWPGLTKASVNIHGKVSALSPFDITGAVVPDPKNPFLDVKLALKNDDLTPFTPYTEKFAGYPLNKGKLSFDLTYKIENRKLQAANVVTIDQFTFGPRNDSTNATKLPVKLAVALLKDRNGRISLDLPVTGSMDDPKFSMSGLVGKAIMNIILKAATSPFSLLGAMFGKGEELQYVDFAPGSASLEGAETNKLATLAKALFERPALSLEISASVESVSDREMLSRQNLKERMKSLRLDELAKRGKPVPQASEFQLEPADYIRLLRKTYKEKFGIDPERALREAQQAQEATNSSRVPSRGLAAAAPRRETTRGATALLSPVNTGPTSKRPKLPPTTAGGTAPAKPKTQEDLVIAEMERRLIAASPATDDDMLNLIKQRTAAVQRFLLDDGEVTTERIFLVAPKRVDPTAKTTARATFSLE
ncbi:MAG: hypothetical protein C5B50_21385 [Verrucomicrobia bacterium]|nr:MAG: hypothetical protein C5B50_21385 [Verrucomicrobiota bacterium]